MTRHHWKVVAASTVLPFVLLLLVAGPALLQYPDYGKAPAAPAILVNLAFATMLVCNSLIAAALYGLISRDEDVQTNAP